MKAPGLRVLPSVGDARSGEPDRTPRIARVPAPVQPALGQPTHDRRTRPFVWVLDAVHPVGTERGPEVGAYRRRQDEVSQERSRGRWLRDRALREGLRDPDAQLTFTRDEAGRPCLRVTQDAMARTDYNVTHTGGTVAVGVVEGERIGLDLERRRPLARDRWRRAFSRSEWAAIEADDDPSTALLRLWTRKEALLKAIGLGLCWPLPDVLSGAEEDDDVLRLRPVAGLDPQQRWWWVFSLAAGPGWLGACAVSSRGQAIAAPIVHSVDPKAAPESVMHPPMPN
jgi:phosphopantetheinyl transferase